MRTAARVMFALVLFVVTTFVVGEVVIRGMDVAPRVVIVRDDPKVVRLDEVGGRVVWEQVERRSPDAPTRKRPECDGTPVHRVHLYGDSIAYGSELTVEQSPGARLEAALNARDGAGTWCVQTFAQPGATLWVQRALADANLPTSRPSVVVIQLWYGSPRVPVRLGDAAYYLDKQVTDPAGYPVLALGLTGTWHHVLFDHSRFWAWTTFVVNPGCDDCGRSWEALLDDDVAAMVHGARAVGATPLLVITPPLDRPFRDTVAEPPSWFAPILTWGAAHDVSVVRLDEALVDDDVTALRLDPCCHYDADGAERVGHILAGHVKLPPASP